MPTASAGFRGDANRPGRDALRLNGPTLLVQIGLDPAYHLGDSVSPSLPEALHAAVVDTGADWSFIDRRLAEELGLPELEEVAVAGIHGTVLVEAYLAQIYVPELDWTTRETLPAVSLRDGGFNCSAILGRTFLQHFLMTYDGRTGDVTISND